MNKYLLVGVVAILIIAGWWYLSQSSSTIVSETNSQQMSQQHTNAVEQPRQQDTGVRAQTNPVSKQQTAPLIERILRRSASVHVSIYEWNISKRDTMFLS